MGRNGGEKDASSGLGILEACLVSMGGKQCVCVILFLSLGI